MHFPRTIGSVLAVMLALQTPMQASAGCPATRTNAVPDRHAEARRDSSRVKGASAATDLADGLPTPQGHARCHDAPTRAPCDAMAACVIYPVPAAPAIRLRPEGRLLNTTTYPLTPHSSPTFPPDIPPPRR